MMKRKFLYKMLTLFVVIVLLYSFITSAIIFYKGYQMSDAQNNHNHQLYIDQNSNYADFKLRIAMEFVYKISTLQSLIDYRYSENTNYLYIANLYKDLINQLQGFGQLGFTFGITKQTDNLVVTATGTFNIKDYLNELGVDAKALERFQRMSRDSAALSTYIIPQSMYKASGKVVMIHRLANSNLDPLYFFIVVDSASLLPKTVDNPQGNFYLYTNEAVSSFIHDGELSPEEFKPLLAADNPKDLNHVRTGSSINYIHHSKVIPNLKYVYSGKATSFGAIFREIWKTALFPSVLLLLLGAMLAYMATRSSYKPIRQLLQFLDIQKGAGNALPDGRAEHELAYIQSSIEQVYSMNHVLQDKLDHSFMHLREDFFRKAIYGIAGEEYISENLSALKLERFRHDLTLLLLDFEGVETLQSRMPAPNLSLLLDSLIQGTREKYGDFFTLPLDRNKYCIIFARISSGSLERIAESIISRIEKDLSLDITAYISGTYHLDELTSALQELLRLSNYPYAATAKKIITSQSVQDLDEVACYYPIELESCLINYVNSNELGKAYDLLKTLLDKNMKEITISPGNLSNLKHSFLTTYKRCLNANGKTLNQFVREYPDLLDEFIHAPLSKFGDHSLKFFESVFHYCNKDKFSLESSTASQIFMYIHQHFDRDLSLTDIAEHFNLSESYVSKLLKNSLDINFKQYVNSLKVKRAKELLHQGNYKIQEVAAIVGCNNTNTFIRIFKQYIGVSPGEYVKSLH